MNTKKRPFLFLLSALLVLSLACSATAPEPTVTVAPTLPPTSTVTPTATIKPTSTPRPTSTPIPPTATAVSIKTPTTNSQYEVTVLYASYFAKVFSGGFEYTPLSLGKFLDIGIVIRNLQPGSELNIPWENVYIIDPNNESWYPNFGGSYAPNNKDEKFDPATLFIYPEESIDSIVFSESVYVRGIWATDGVKPATYLFGFDTSPLIEVVID